jgi:glycine hydroxymethyltransferase
VVNVICPLYSSQLKPFLHVSVLVAGPKLKDFRAAVDTDPEVQAEIGKLKAEVEEFAKQFPTTLLGLRSPQ